jgi:XRE family transcriptional regulator, aerobic/anaerobic benzoate catabolism transcriptional regulator
VRKDSKPAAEPRRGNAPQDETYLRLVGDRLRLTRAGRGMSRKVLAQASGVSERYLAELERGAGNASLLVLRQISAAMGVRVADLVSETGDRAVDLKLMLNQLEQLSPADLADARTMIANRFGRAGKAQPETLSGAPQRIALTGLRGAGKSTLGRQLADRLGVAFIELDREIERASGMDLAEVFAGEGQSGFRRREYDCLAAAIAGNERCVIATGGSLVTEPGTYDLLLSACFVVWLSAAPETHMARVTAQGDLRPMKASRQAMDDLRTILESRHGLYAKADAQLDTSATTEAEALAALIGLVGRYTAGQKIWRADTSGQQN